MTETAAAHQPITLRHFFALALGIIIGVGWISVMGDWLRQAGSGGAMLAFLFGTLIVLPAGLCYAELAHRYPGAGGGILYCYRAFGSFGAFMMGWALLFAYITTILLLVAASGWLATTIAPAIRGPILYDIGGSPISLGAICVAAASTAWLAIVNIRGGVASNRLQEWILILLMLVSLTFIGGGVISGDIDNLRPLFVADRNGSIWPGILIVTLMAAFFLSGFEAVAQGMGERADDVSGRGVFIVIAGAILLGAFFYIAVIFGAAIVAPRDVLLSADLPAAEAFRIGLHSESLANLVLFVGVLGLVSTWNGCLFVCIRLLRVMSKAGFLPLPAPRSDATDMFGPVLLTSVIGLLGGFLGQQAIGPLANAGALGIGLIYVMICLTVIRLNRTTARADRLFRGWAGAAIPYFGLVVWMFLAASQFYLPFMSGDGQIPPDQIGFAIVILLGVILYFARLRNGGDASRHVDFLGIRL